MTNTTFCEKQSVAKGRRYPEVVDTSVQVTNTDIPEGFPKIRSTFLGAPIRWIIVYWGLYYLWGQVVLGNHHVELSIRYFVPESPRRKSATPL